MLIVLATFITCLAHLFLYSQSHPGCKERRATSLKRKPSISTTISSFSFFIGQGQNRSCLISCHQKLSRITTQEQNIPPASCLTFQKEHLHHCLLVRKTGEYCPYFTDGEPDAGHTTCPVTQLTSSRACISYHSPHDMTPRPGCLPLHQGFLSNKFFPKPLI